MSLPKNALIQFSTGCWGFVGSVRADLCYVQIDGSPATDAQLEKARQFGPRLAGVKTRVFTTESEALAALAGEVVTV